MEHAARISRQVTRLGRLPHHPQHYFVADEIKLARADSRPAASPNSSKHAQLLALEALSSQAREFGAGGGKASPVHRGPRSIASRTSTTRGCLPNPVSTQVAPA